MEIQTLKLLSPLYYSVGAESHPFGCQAGEKLYCFELDENERNSFEPNKEKLLGSLVFGGETAGERPGKTENAEAFFSLPQGDYLFAQKREALSRDEIIDMAIEIQQEGLWQRHKLGKLLYLRYLHEDGSGVTQLFRPCT